MVIGKIEYMFRSLNQTLAENTKMSAYSMEVVGVLGTVLHVMYGILWLYVTPLEHENFWMRAFGAISCFLLLINKSWPAPFKKLLPWYWFAVVMYTLPFFATYHLFGSNYSVLRSMLEITMIFFVILAFPQPILAILNMGIGITLAILFAYMIMPGFSTLNHHLVLSIHLQAVIYTLVVGLIFSRSNLKGLLAQEKIETLKDLAGSIAHEMRNPLSQIQYSLDAIGGNLQSKANDRSIQALQGQQLDELDRWLQKGQTAIKRGQQAIDMILNEIKSKAIDTSQFTTLSAAQIAQKAVDEFGYKSDALRRRVKLVVVQDFSFKGEETLFLFVLYNLIKNALYYFPLRPEAHLTLTVERHRIRVKDTGPGILPEVLPKLFESFHTSGKSEGTGLGLSFCKRTMRAFGGDITCDSVLGQYTEFTLTFAPLTQAETDAAPSAPAPAVELAKVEAAAVLARAAEAATSPEITLKGKTILVAEDDEGNREMLQMVLGGAGMRVLHAEHGQAAIAQLEAHPHIDLVLMDLDMPGMDGVEATLTIRKHPCAYQKVPIVILSGNVDAEDIEAKLAGQVDDFLVKSGDMRLLQQKMLEVLKKSAQCV